MMGIFGEVYRTRCTRCQAVQVHHNKPLETVRMNCCPTCHIRTVVIGHEAADRNSKNFERGIAPDEDSRARAIFERAFGGKD